MKDSFVQINLSGAIRAHQSMRQGSSWIDTNSGAIINFLNIEHRSIQIEDIAQGLSNTCRFAGQIQKFYSVAEHSVLVYKYCKDKLKDLPHGAFLGVLMSALMHDAPEAYIGDMTTPLKILCPGFKVIEADLEKVLRETFGLDVLFSHAMIKEADKALFEIERFKFRGDEGYETKFKLPEDVEIRNLPPEEARLEFLACVKELGIQRRPREELSGLTRAPC